MTARKIPRRLYRYRPFNNQTLDMLVGEKLFFADPATFNDPLDTKPCLSTDLENGELEDILRQMIEQRVHAEMSAAAKTIKYSGPRTVTHIDDLSRKLAQNRIEQIRERASWPSDDDGTDTEHDRLKFDLGLDIENELLSRYGSGIVSLAVRETCPLMWSHYADQHNGICIGYSVPDDAALNVHKVNYGGSRLVHASSVAAMLRGDEDARRRVDDACLTRKARNWRYECEWRMIGARGLHESRLHLEEVIFGLRCSDTVRYSVVRALEKRPSGVEFYEIVERRDEFVLRRQILETGELCAHFPRDRKFDMSVLSPIDVSDLVDA
jgi:hypothetical protein